MASRDYLIKNDDFRDNIDYGAIAAEEAVVIPGIDGAYYSNRLFRTKGDCCGCGACASICPIGAIEMKPDNEGFLFPVIDGSRCLDCSRCDGSCAYKMILHGKRTNPENEQLVYAAWHSNDEVRAYSSSGGAFWGLGEGVILEHGVVYGCGFDGSFNARHIRCENLDEMKKCQGSKYSQSITGDCYDKVAADLESSKPVLFSGTPCQVDALIAFLDEKGVCQDLLTSVDIICHGVPSPGVFQKHITFIETERRRRLVGYWHRPKDLGWRHEEKFELEGGATEIETPLSRLWKRVFYSNLALRCSCYICPYAKLTRVSDITIGDFWGIGDRIPELYDTRGVSVIITNTAKGKSSLTSATNLMLTRCSMEDVLPRNPLLEKPTYLKRPRNAFFDTLAMKGYARTVKEYGWYGIVRSTKDFLNRKIRR